MNSRSLDTKGARVANTFYERPILNSPYEKPRFHHPLDEHGQPLGLPPVESRRPSKFIVPVPQARRRGAAAQAALPLETYSDSAIISEIRGHVDAWRCLPGGSDWGVTPTTQRLLEHWRHFDFSGQRPFFCQIEAIETLILLLDARTRTAPPVRSGMQPETDDRVRPESHVRRR